MRKLIALLITCVLLLLVADRAAWWVARNAIAEGIQSSEALSQRPEVSVGGFPFLTQAYRGLYRQIDVTLRDAPVNGDLTLDSLAVRLEGVEVAASDLISRQVSTVALEAASADAAVSYRALDAVAAANLPDSDAEVRFGPAPEGLMAISATYPVAGEDLQVEVQARLLAEDDNLAVELVPGALETVPAAIRADVSALIEQAVELPELPFGFQARSVTAGPDGIAVRAETDALVLER